MFVSVFAFLSLNSFCQMVNGAFSFSFAASPAQKPGWHVTFTVLPGKFLVVNRF